MQLIKKISSRTLVEATVVLFLVAVAIHIVCGDFPKAIDVLPDERRYLEIARSLFSGNGLIIRGGASTFQKILYPISLFPALLFPDGETQIRVIGILNSAYACSAVFPVLLIARKIFRSPAPIFASVIFTLLLPDLMYSMTFMSESVFLPIALWLVYLCWRCFESCGKRMLALAASAGLLCYAAYLCKEVAWMFLIAFITWYLKEAFAKRRRAKDAAAPIACFLAAFFIPFALMKLTLFSGLANSYSQFSFDILLSPYTTLFGLYSLVTDGVYFIIGFGVFPVLYLALTYRDAKREHRDLLFLCFVSLVVGLLVVVFTISMREDVGHVALRQHLRYVAPLYLPLLMLFIKQVTHFDSAAITSSPRRLAIASGATIGFCALVAAFFGSGNLRQGFDFSQFHFLRWLLKLSEQLPQSYFDGTKQTMSDISTSDGDLLPIDPLDWACRAAVIAFTILGMWFLLSKRKRTRLRCRNAICAILAIAMTANTIALFDYNRNAYDVEQSDVDDICAISDQLRERTTGGDVIVVLDDSNTGPNNLIDTYLQDGAGEYRYLVIDDFKKLINQRSKEKKTDENGSGSEAFKLNLEEKVNVGPLDDVSYILTNSKQSVNLSGFDVEEIKISNAEEPTFALYEVL